MEQLRVPHASIPRNPLICEPMFLARYAEKAGSGILDMIALCREAGLPEPTFEQRGTQFVTTMDRAPVPADPRSLENAGKPALQDARQVGVPLPPLRFGPQDPLLDQLTFRLPLPLQ